MPELIPLMGQGCKVAEKPSGVLNRSEGNASSSWYEQCVASVDVTLVALGHLVSKEYLALIGGHDPLLVAQ